MRAALVFPGQGSQRPAMGAPWEATPAWDRVREASDLLGRDVGALLLHADAEQLRATREAQLTTFVTSLVVAASVPDLEVAVVAGHSLGDFTALVAAGVLSFADGLHLVAERGAAMQEAADARPGTMAAVLGLDDDGVDAVCADVDAAWPANYNAPAHVVVSGTVEGVAAAGQALKDAGARRVLPLPVGGAFHTPLMQPAQARLDAALATASYGAPVVPVVSGVTARAYDDVARTLSEQLVAPVRWRQTCAALAAYGVDTVVEVGPGGVLTGLVKRCLPGVRAVAVSIPDELVALGH
jgi:[acyl-carrier-protein] S-malonyltransferase